MHVSRRALLWLLIAVAVVFGYQNLSRAGQEVVVLRTTGPAHQDHFASLWVVDDGHFSWIRAENPRRLWLTHLRSNPEIELRRKGRTIRYRAALFDTDEARAYTDSRFRAKYGFADWIRAVLTPRDVLPIRLEPR